MPLHVAGFGLGSKGRIELEICRGLDDVRVVAGADVSADARDRFEAEFEAPTYEDYADLLDRHAAELDAVVVSTPHTLHREHALACFERDLDVFLEKPLATSIGDALDIVEAAEARGRVLEVGYQRHFHPALRRLKEAVDDGEIGDVHMVSGYLEQEWIGPQQGTWRTDPSLSGGGQLYDSGAHLLDTLLWLTDADPATVASTMDRRGHEVDVDSALAATLERDGETITASIGVTGDGAAYPNTSERLLVWGTQGAVRYDRTLDGEIEAGVVEKAGPEATPSYEPVDDDVEFAELTEHKLRDFFEAVRGEHDPAVPGEFGLQVTALTEAVRLADERGERISVPAEIDAARRG
jgi:predicted dehydrogenase